MLTLWADGLMKPPTSTDSAKPTERLTNKSSIRAVSKLNPQTGILSNVSSNFSTENWGGTTWSYLKSIEETKT